LQIDLHEAFMPDQLDLAVHPPSSVLKLRDALGFEWPSITAARERAASTLDTLRRDLYPLIPRETTLVIYGSLARHEFTQGSDVDWTLLADGAASAEHPTVARRIEGRLREKGLKEPSPGGAFGNLTFSHDLIHRIGGEDDSNSNTTQRLLLLLESTPIGNPEAYKRVVRNVLERYIEEDLIGPGDSPYRVPRFLLNDVVRYWRTMAVDFAHKRRARATKGWALRTAKLRMSRKLMYAAGLVSCYSCDDRFGSHREHYDSRHRERATSQIVDHLSVLVGNTPLDIVADAVLYYFGKISVPAGKLFGAYDEFLAILNDRDTRDHLKNLPPEAADDDAVYAKVREIGARFQDALTSIFFDSDTPLRELTRRYGVF
jgi:hypothetical protein